MGISYSKVVPAPQKADPTQSHLIHVDPRSPTVNISRSPIHSEHSYALNVTKGKDLTSVLSEIPECVQTPERRLAERFQSIVDPRSPTTFTRTPLTVTSASPGTESGADESSLQYAEISINDEYEAELSFKDCETLPAIGDLQIGPDEQPPLVDTVIEELEQTVYEDALAPAYLGFDPRSPSIQIDRTPIVLRDVEEEEGENGKAIASAQSVMDGQESKTEPHEQHEQSSLSQTPSDTTPKRAQDSASKAIKGPRTPLSCMTNAYASGGGSSIRKTALLGHIRQNNATDGKKQADRTGPVTTTGGSAEVIRTNKQKRRSMIPTLRMS